MKLSVVLAVFNEENNIAKCLESVRQLADEIVIVDGQSSDKTVEIAKKYRAKVISTPNLPTHFHEMKNKAIKAATKDWILQLDADEVVSPELAQGIRDIISKPYPLTSKPCNGFWLPRKNYFLGRFLTKGGQYPDYTLRLYKNGKGSLPALDVHEQAVVEGEVGYLKHDLLHYGTPDFESYLLRNNKYTSLMAEQMQVNKVSFGILPTINYLFIKPIKEFVWIYFRHRGYVDGFPGFVFALFSGLRFGVAYIKYWQIIKYPSTT